MIKITIETIPPILSGKKKQTIAVGQIINDGSGTKRRGNYRAIFFKKQYKIWKEVEIKDFPRLSYDVWTLLWRCLNEIFKSNSS